ncbi:MAG: translation initiation factor IF-3 [Oscillospiraceae bacterium]|nr:translation initiation factor IF-3 [Oscillospiraceae bacterium]
MRIIKLEVLSISKLAHQVNEDIRDKEIRLIDETGEQCGVMAAQAALDLAYEKDLDLVKISPGAKPPVCKIMDYGKYKFEQSKREKEAKKNQHVVEIKEIRMSPVIDTNDFNVKLRNGHKFLQEGNRLKVTIRFRGRQMAHTDIGAKVLKRYAEACEEIATVEKNPKLEGRNMSMFLSPKVQKPEKAEKPPKAEKVEKTEKVATEKTPTTE